MMNKNSSYWLSQDAWQQVAAVKNGHFSARALVEASLVAAEKNCALNAIISLDPNGALDTADRLDRGSGKSVALPLVGLPIVVKDNIASARLPTTGATQALQRFQANRNAPSLQRLLDAGAILIGKANLHELASGATCAGTSSFPGSVRNPHAPLCFAGGSSGGTAAAIAAGIVSAGLGTDTGGSLRIPAALTGIVGFRPTHHRLSKQCRYDSRGLLPISPHHDTVGPMARTVSDIRLLDHVLSGRPMVKGRTTLSGKRFGISSWAWEPMSEEVRIPMHRALERLAQAGIELVHIDLKELDILNEKVSPIINLYEPLASIPDFLRDYGRELWMRELTLDFVVEKMAGQEGRDMFERTLAGATAQQYTEAISRHSPALTQYFVRKFRDHRLDAICLPTTLFSAREIDRPADECLKIGERIVSRFEGYIRNTTPISSAGLPSVSIPGGSTGAGLPVGLELSANLGEDEELLVLAESVAQYLREAADTPLPG